MLICSSSFTAGCLVYHDFAPREIYVRNTTLKQNQPDAPIPQIRVGMTWEEAEPIIGSLTDKPPMGTTVNAIELRGQATDGGFPTWLYWNNRVLNAIICRGWSIEPW